MYLELDNLACMCISLGQALLGGGLRVYVASIKLSLQSSISGGNFIIKFFSTSS